MPSGVYKRKPLEQRFWEKVKRRGEDECWEWGASRYDNGYGQFQLDNREARICAHRMAYQLKHGPIPEGLLVLHSCDNPPCVNPKHLFLGTHQDNADDKKAKGRSNTGERHGMSKLTEEIVRSIRESNLTQKEEAKKWGITRVQISHVRNRKSWKHIK